ncbi:MAG: 3-dehydroquinate synthase, partial [Candidatus Marinimicrobia bacterium]|nr:3-dehydroquinate synthase [Candidatus Neomarinimicrobiota bacterium]
EEEKAKSLQSLELIFSKLIQFGCDRSSTFLALGGGVVGDVTGFIAATFMRGVDYIQIPTTLLAMVDSSIGGKTGVNLKEGKNLVGAIWQPKAVIIDPNLLETLPEKEVTSALGEVIKYGAILDKRLLLKVKNNLTSLLQRENSNQFEDIIGRCAELKAGIVAEDEREGDKRRILNFGHTIGHALETHFGFDTLRHGEAVAYGMLAAGRLSFEYGRLKDEELDFLNQTIGKLPLPELPEFNPEDILKIMRSDKKVKDGEIHFVLLEELGKAVISGNVTEGAIVKVLNEMQSSKWKNQHLTLD